MEVIFGSCDDNGDWQEEILMDNFYDIDIKNTTYNRRSGKVKEPQSLQTYIALKLKNYLGEKKDANIIR